MSESLTKCKDEALNILSYAMRTEKQVRDKLKEKGFYEEDIEETVSYLKEYSYLDDLKYAVMYIRYAGQKGHGRRRIETELAKRGIGKSLMEDAWYEHEKQLMEDGIEVPSERDRAYEAALKVVGTKPVDDKLIAKVGRRLQTLGFDSDATYYAVGRIMKMKNQEN